MWTCSSVPDWFINSFLAYKTGSGCVYQNDSLNCCLLAAGFCLSPITGTKGDVKLHSTNRLRTSRVYRFDCFVADIFCYIMGELQQANMNYMNSLFIIMPFIRKQWEFRFGWHSDNGSYYDGSILAVIAPVVICWY